MFVAVISLMDSCSKLIIGGAQFGEDYGITNEIGQVKQQTINTIMEISRNNGIFLYDTAPDYGASETALGSLLGECDRVVTKTAKSENQALTALDIDDFESTFQASMGLIGRKKIYAILVHRAFDLLKPGKELLIDWLLQKKKEEQVDKVGVSVYTEEQLNEILKVFRPDVVQLPFNILDQRLHQSGCLKKLALQGIEVHVRSVFLQGLLLIPPERLPTYFQFARKYFDAVMSVAEKQGYSALELSLGFVMNHKYIDKVIVGICDKNQLLQIIDACSIVLNSEMYHGLACDDESVVHPGKWVL